ncbi:serine/threonine-protein kinase/endoribonuclease IRE1-like isoform X2 [Daphnia pulicaria]|uniref:serine/threonine-protein kinase/endoribonuclease IRE1-like isoform X2 n=1 Tax=Daphnia pulicaria TaxID=35523 RepID=UPI001EE9C956|nr:serine/threonine-protein kinase/endoribonuclease IRE1-like isoform X2 [Daphnia pulicaria]
MGEEMVFLNDNEIRFCRKDIIGRGGNGVVFRGSFSGQNVAVKRIQLIDANYELNSRELLNLRQLKHDNIVEFIHVEDNDDFRFIVFELCYANLREYCKPVYTGQVLSDESDQLKVLLQLTQALEYIHSKDIIHRDIKPENILVSNKDSVKMKWADFGHSKLTNERGSTSMSGRRGTKAWLAKEIIPFFNRDELGGRCSKNSDIFAAGCVFFYFLTRGIHPYGEENRLIEQNILSENIVNKNELNDGHAAKKPVIQMMEERLDLAKVIECLNASLS